MIPFGEKEISMLHPSRKEFPLNFHVDYKSFFNGPMLVPVPKAMGIYRERISLGDNLD